MYAYEYVYRMYFLAPRKKDERNRAAVHGSPSSCELARSRAEPAQREAPQSELYPGGGVGCCWARYPRVDKCTFLSSPFQTCRFPSASRGCGRALPSRGGAGESAGGRGSSGVQARPSLRTGTSPGGGTSLVSTGSESALTWEWESRTSRSPRRTPSSPKMRGHRCLTPPRQARTDAGSSLCAAVPVPSPRRRDVIPAERLRFGCWGQLRASSFPQVCVHLLESNLQIKVRQEKMLGIFFFFWYKVTNGVSIFRVSERDIFHFWGFDFFFPHSIVDPSWPGPLQWTHFPDAKSQKVFTRGDFLYYAALSGSAAFI